LDGGAGYDTVDYTDFGQAVTLTPSGIVEKANGHSDLLINVEKIVGAVGQDNKIDALSASGDSVYLDADLSANRLTVKGIAGLGDLNFEVENFRHISGTNQSDRMIGNDDNNILEGYDGSDTLDGGAGYDTVDYTDFGQAVTLTPSGIVEKANGHSDLLINVEKIVGAVGQDNKLDALSASGDSVYLDADLSTNRLTVKGISGLGDLNFEVLHFRNLSGTNQSDIMSGNDDNNILEGHDGNDIMYAGLGNDTLDGGGYFDTVDYRNYGQAITITPTGVVEKANGQNDLLINVEKIVGAVAQENKIDAISVFGDAVYLDADLSANRLTVKGIAELGDLNFEVVNFRHLSGTNQSDKMIGNDSNNIFEGYDGSDTLDGGAGYDTVDYTEFGQAVTVTPTGIVKKANGHSDLLINVEKIVGATGQSNKIDASSAPADTVNLYVDLSLEQLLVKDIPVIGEQDFQVVNFLNVSGTNQADTIIGDSHSNILEGNGGNDILSGSSQNYYAAEIDIVTGGDGADKFVLGDYTEAFYQGDGFARITDFDSSEGDRLVAFGTAEDYTISQFEGGANISYQGDVVAFVVNTNDVDLYSDFEFV
ncbi:hypothetical protein Xen7305DRAFT_00017780, partial [Xenococcus sp. PCC 7305]|uniref:calcium-binding protein n=1 Tax=Xenococcus sp. PCC 7305 TaxID=102125 RepID=UPI0002AD0043